MAIAHYSSLAGGSLLMVIAIIWGIAAVASPSWQVVDLTEYQSVHEHGLWQDCTRTHRTGNYEGAAYETEGPLHCTYKFDYRPGQLVPVHAQNVDANSPAGEHEHHVLHAYQVSTLVLIGSAIFVGTIALCFACVAFRYPSCTKIVTFLYFICVLLTLGAVGSFFFFAHQADNRFVKGVIGTYEAGLGHAYYFEVVSCVFHFLAFICSLLTSYVFLRTEDADGDWKRGSERGEPLLEQNEKYDKVIHMRRTKGDYNVSPRRAKFREPESNM